MANIKGFNYGLRECPFCGSSRVIYDKFQFVKKNGDAFINCQDCGALISFPGGLKQPPRRTIMDVVAAYSRRAEDD